MKQLRFVMATVLVGGILIGCSRNQVSHSDSATTGPQTAPSRSQAQALPKSSNGAEVGHDHAAEMAVTRISITEAKTAVDRGDAVFLDVRQPDPHNTTRIRGAILMPEDEIPTRAGTLPKGKKVITYCT